MPVIDRAVLLADVHRYIGDANTLDDSTIDELGEDVILEVGDDDAEYKKVRCLTLKKVAEVNQAMATLDLGRGIKRDESYERVVEWHKGTDPVSYWGDYLDMLPKLCSALGYCGLNSRYAGKFKANVATPIRVPAGSPEVGTVEKKAYWNGKPILPGA